MTGPEVAYNDSRITPPNSPGGSILQWATGRDLPCLAALDFIFIRTDLISAGEWQDQ